MVGKITKASLDLWGKKGKKIFSCQPTNLSQWLKFINVKSPIALEGNKFLPELIEREYSQFLGFVATKPYGFRGYYCHHSG
jgi:hypothetical protein